MKHRHEKLISRLGYPVMTLLRPLVKFLWVEKVCGLHNIPAKGPYLVAANHESYFDFILFIAVSKRKIHYLAAEKFYIHPFWKWVMAVAGSIRVDRYSIVNIQAYKAVRRAATQGRLIGIYPEGTRSPDGRLLRGKKGIAYLVLRTGLPVIPVGMRGTREIMSVRDQWPRLKKARINIGPPMHFDHVKGKPINDEIMQNVTDQIMMRISDLTGKEYNFVTTSESSDVESAAAAAKSLRHEP